MQRIVSRSSSLRSHLAEVSTRSARLNYVNSFPVTAVKYGLKTVAPKYFSKPDFVLAGPNVGCEYSYISNDSTALLRCRATSQPTLVLSAFSPALCMYLWSTVMPHHANDASIVHSGVASEGALEGIPSIAFSGADPLFQ